jgi:hypothetical protein
MRTFVVVVGHVPAEHAVEVATPKHKDPVQALGAHCPHKALRERVRTR